MKKYFLILILLITGAACNKTPEPIGNNIPNIKFLYDAKVVEIDSCEYIIYAGYASWHTTHKGNCKFCQRRLEETIKKIADNK